MGRRRRPAGSRTASGRDPVAIERVVTGIFWRVPSLEVARDATAVLQDSIDRGNVSTGPDISLYRFFAVSDRHGACLVLIGVGSMFSAVFLAECEKWMQQYEGSLLPNSERTRVLLNQVHAKWIKTRKQDLKEVRDFLRRKAANSRNADTESFGLGIKN